MAHAYGEDMRVKALAALGRGERPGTVARLFGISRNTLNLWRQRQAATGSCAARRGYQKGHGAKITDWEAFRRFVDEHGGQPLEERPAPGRDGGAARRGADDHLAGPQEARLHAQKKTYG